jgi:hypothetical protein
MHFLQSCVFNLARGVKLPNAHCVQTYSGELPPIRPKASVRCTGNSVVLDTAMRSHGITYNSLSYQFEQYKPIHFSNNSFNMYAAIRTRVTMPLINPDKDILKDFWSWRRQAFQRLLPRGVPDGDFMEWLSTCNSTPSMKAQYLRSYQQLQASGQQRRKWVPVGELLRECKSKIHLKIENLLYKTPAGLKQKSARCIFGCRPRLVVETAAWIKNATESLKTRWGIGSPIVYAGSMTGERQGQWADFKDYGLWYEDDVSKWDSSVCEELLRFLADLAKYMGAPARVVAYMRKSVKTIGRTSHGIRVKTPGGVKTGSPWTSFGNSLLNGFIHLFIYQREHGLTLNDALKEFRILVMGDDSAINCKRVTDFKASMSLFGFKAETIKRDKLHHVGFCSAFFLPTVRGTVLVPNPVRVLMKFGTFHTLPPHMNYSEMVKGAAKSVYNSMCIWPAFARELKVIASSLTVSKEWMKLYAATKNRIADWDVWNSKPVQLISEGLVELDRKFPGGLREVLPFCFSRYGDFGTDGPTFYWSKSSFGI